MEITKVSQIRDAVKKAIEDKKSFQELRDMLPGVRKSHILTVVFDVKDEMGLPEMPFPDAICRPRIKRDMLEIDDEGKIDISDLLKEKGYDKSDCIVRPHLGNGKITLTVRKRNNEIV